MTQSAHHQKLHTLYTMVTHGELSRERFEDLLSQAIDQELEKPSHQMDTALICACEQWLERLHLETAPPIPSREKQNWKQLKKNIRRKDQAQNQPLWLPRLVKVTALIFLCVFLFDALSMYLRIQPNEDALIPEE
ncbi:MAG: hypothetical protein GX786_08960, partial [Clostridiales bacterium]|nr:hypothetical protein [Clostridiales bacterium]